MDELYLGQIMLFAGNFAPRNTAFCAGQLLPINQNQALFSILGTTYGGDGRTTFALPDLRGRVAIQQGNGPGLTDRRLGQKGGEEIHYLTQLEMPSHTHTARASASGASISGNATATINTNTSADTDSADGTFLANNSGGDGFASDTGDTTLNSAAISVNTSNLSVNIDGLGISNLNTGGSQAHNNMQPWLATNYIICINGMFPSRS